MNNDTCHYHSDTIPTALSPTQAWDQVQGEAASKWPLTTAPGQASLLTGQSAPNRPATTWERVKPIPYIVWHTSKVCEQIATYFLATWALWQH